MAEETAKTLPSATMLLTEAVRELVNKTIENVANHTKEGGGVEAVEEESEEAEAAPHIFFFLACTLLFGAFVQRYAIKQIPYTVMMFLMGGVLGLVAIIWPSFEELVPLKSLPPIFIFYIFFPILIFQGAFDWEAKVFRAVVKQVLLLAFPGLILNSFATGFCCKFMMYPEWSMLASVLYGSIISATDPVATVALLRELGADKYITGIIEGEALINDGSAIVLYVLLMPSVHAGHLTFGFGGLIVQSFQLVFGAVLVGAICGALMVYCLEHTHDEPLVEITVTLGFSYVAFYIADHVMGFSGVITLVTAGLCFSFRRYAVTPEHAKTLNEFWEVLVHLANTVIFTMCGFYVIKDGTQFVTAYDVCMLVVLYVCLCLIRAAMIALAWPIMNMVFPLSWQSVALISFSGLRGAVALTLALVIKQDPKIDEHTRHIFLFLTAGIVVITIVANGIAGGPVVKALGLSSKDAGKRAVVHAVCQEARNAMRATMSRMKTNSILYNASWGTVRSQTLDAFVDPYNGREEAPVLKDRDQHSLGVHSYMRILKSSIFLAHAEGMIDYAAFYAMLTLANNRIEKSRTFTFDDVQRMLHPTSFLFGSHNSGARAMNAVILRVVPGMTWRLTIQNFEMSLAYRLALTNILQTFPSARVDQDTRVELLELATKELDVVERHLADLDVNEPEASLELKTRVCGRSMLNRARKIVECLEEKGDIAHEDAEAIMHNVKHLMHGLPHSRPMEEARGGVFMFTHLEILNDLSSSERTELFRSCAKRLYDPEEHIVLNDEDHVLVVTSGIIRCARKDTNLDIASEDDVCLSGEGTLIGWISNTRGSEAVRRHCDTLQYTAVTAVEVVSIPRRALVRQMTDTPALERRMWKHESAPHAYHALRVVPEYREADGHWLNAACQAGYLVIPDVEGPWVMEGTSAGFVLLSGQSAGEPTPRYTSAYGAVALPQSRHVISWEIGTRIFVVPHATGGDVAGSGAGGTHTWRHMHLESDAACLPSPRALLSRSYPGPGVGVSVEMQPIRDIRNLRSPQRVRPISPSSSAALDNNTQQLSPTGPRIRGNPDEDGVNLLSE
eukprot:PhM_4_TR10042/c0_g1_i1/m.99280